MTIVRKKRAARWFIEILNTERIRIAVFVYVPIYLHELNNF